MSSKRNGTPWYTPSTDEKAAPQKPRRNTPRPMGRISLQMGSASNRQRRGPSSRICPVQSICVARKIIEMQKMKTSENDTVRSPRACATRSVPAQPASRIQYPYESSVTVPPTPPMSDNVYAVENSERAPAPDQSAPDHSTISSAEAMMAPNFRPMNHFTIARKRSYRPHQTMTNA